MIEEEYLAHYGIQGQKWGVRKYENYDGTLTPEGKERYGKSKNKYGASAEKIDKYQKIKAKAIKSDDPKLIYKYRKLFTDQEIENWKKRFDNESDIMKHIPPKKKNMFEKAFDKIKKGTIDMIQKPFNDFMNELVDDLFKASDEPEEQNKKEKQKQKQKEKRQEKQKEKRQESNRQNKQDNSSNDEIVNFYWMPKNRSYEEASNYAKAIELSLVSMRDATDQWYEDKTNNYPRLT